MQSNQKQTLIPNRDYSLWQKHSSTYSSLTLPTINFDSFIPKIFSLIYSASYQTRYSFILEVFFDDLTGIDLTTTQHFLQNLYNFVTPFLLENPYFEFTIILPQLTKADTVLTRTITPTLEVIFEHEGFSLSNSPHHKSTNVSCAVQQLALISNDISPNDYCVKLDPNVKHIELKSHGRSCLGGTYDHFHVGHRLFLSFSALVSRDYMLIGLTSDEMLAKKTHKSAIECFETRYNSVRKFLHYFDPKLEVDVVEINDPVGPAKDGNFDIIVVTQETVKGGAYVNNLRKEGGYSELEVIVANVVSNTGEVQDKLSSTNVREHVLEKVEGRDDVLEELYREWDELMEEINVKEKRFIGYWFDRMKEKYCESWRYYHTLTHVWYLLRMCKENLDKIEEKDVVKLSAWFHDVIYIPQNPNNEKDSVKLFEDFVEDLDKRTEGKHSLTKEKQEKIKKIILYTINHTQTAPEAKEWFDAKFFLDIDLGILGGEEEDYAKYAKNVRKEYCHVPDQMFREKRAEFMSKFVNKDLEIYKTELFKNKLEEKAISNIKKEIDMLTGKDQTV